MKQCLENALFSFPFFGWKGCFIPVQCGVEGEKEAENKSDFGTPEKKSQVIMGSKCFRSALAKFWKYTKRKKKRGATELSRHTQRQG